MNSEIKEYDDRWIIQPLRGSRIANIEWRADGFEFHLDSGFRIAAGYGTELSPRSLAEDDPNRHAITHWPKSKIEKTLTEPIVSPVFFKSGSFRIGFRNGWNMFVSDRHPEIPAEVLWGDILIWNRSGIANQSGYPVVTVDKWSGARIQAPPWPSRPADLEINYNSDDIND